MQYQNVLEGFQQRVGSRFIDSSQPSLKLLKHLLGIFITPLLQSGFEPPVSFLPVLLGQMSLDVPILMDRTPLVDQFLPKALLECLEDPFPSIRNPKNL